MIRLIDSGKFWLKLVFYGLLAASLLLVGTAASVYRFFSPERISEVVNSRIHDTRRTVHFDQNIGRSWFPRPSVKLRNVAISKPGSSQTEVFIQETDIGLAWESLWSDDPVLEKWVIKGADTVLERLPSGRWNLQDLWQQQARGGRLNRLIVENSKIRLKLMHGGYRINAFKLDTGASGSDGRQFEMSGVLQHDLMPLKWQGSGVIKPSGANWNIPEFHLSAEGRLKNHTLKISSDSRITWQPKTALLKAENISVRADSSYRNLHANTQIPLISFNADRLSVSSFNTVVTAEEHNTNWNGSIRAGDISVRPTVASVGNIELKGEQKNAALQTNLSVSGSLIWQHDAGLKFDDLAINTVQNAVGKSPNPRFAGSLKGAFAMPDLHRAEARLSGWFDRQPIDAVLKYAAEPQQDARLEAGISLKKLSLQPYWQDFLAQSGQIYPSLLMQKWMPKIEVQLQIGRIRMPGLQLDNVETLMSVDSRHIAFSNFKADLYGGRTEGGISMANTQPIAYHLQQNAAGVNIKPLLEDLFGFHNFSGSGDMVVDVTAEGQDRKSLISSLGGTLTLNVADGAWVGIDMNNILEHRRIDNNSEVLQTPFERFSLNSVIEKGVSHHLNAELFSHDLAVSTTGHTDLLKQELNEELLIYNAKNPELKPIPLKISGPIRNLSITLDYARLTDGLATPQEKKQALEETFREQWQWLIPHNK